MKYLNRYNFATRFWQNKNFTKCTAKLYILYCWNTWRNLKKILKINKKSRNKFWIWIFFLKISEYFMKSEKYCKWMILKYILNWNLGILKNLARGNLAFTKTNYTIFRKRTNNYVLDLLKQFPCQSNRPQTKDNKTTQQSNSSRRLSFLEVSELPWSKNH